MKNPQALTPMQVAVLTWIDNGSPAETYPDGYAHRITARALERRGLASVTGHGPSWSATITQAGREWLSAPVTGGNTVTPSEADTLLEQVADNDGVLVLPESFDRAHMERIIRQSLKAPSRPRGKRLELRRQGNWRSNSWVVAYADHVNDLVEKRPVPIPERVGKYHPMVRAYLDDRDHQQVSKEHLTRAARLLQAITTEATQRGLELQSETKARATRPPTPNQAMNSHLRIGTTVGSYTVNIKEIPGTGGNAIDYSRRYDPRKPSWLSGRQTEFVSTGRLELILEGPGLPYGGSKLRDAKRSTIEDRLPDLFASLDAGMLTAKAAAEAAQRREEQRRLTWEKAMENARTQFAAHKRWEHFQRLATTSATLRQHREFLQRAEAAAHQLPTERQTAAMAFLNDMRHTIDELDPLTSPELIVPLIPEPSLHDLQPFTGGLSPWGPDR